MRLLTINEENGGQMRLLKITEEFRTETENEAKELMEKARQEAASKGYEINSCGYTHKEKKSKGEVIDEAFIVKVCKVYGGVWD